jgi:hypothetical protein
VHVVQRLEDERCVEGVRLVQRSPPGSAKLTRLLSPASSACARAAVTDGASMSIPVTVASG